MRSVKQSDELLELPFDKYRIVTMKRSELKGARYNPRVITEAEKKKLSAGLKKHGMVMPPVWNKRTSTLVGDHQRLTALDALAAGADYTIQIAEIDVNETEEKELNILLNNLAAQGDWDLPKLEILLSDQEVQLDGTGFSIDDVYKLFGDAPMAERSSDELTSFENSIRAARARHDSIVEKTDVRDSVGFFVVLVFRNDAHCNEFRKRFGLDDNRFQDGRKIQALLDEAGAGGNSVEQGNVNFDQTPLTPEQHNIV